MTETDNYGQESSQKIVNSGVREVFTPHAPVQTSSLLSGREPEIQALTEALTTPGLHATLYGDRGVGKSSLANAVSSFVVPQVFPEIVPKRCDSNDRFINILEPILEKVGIDIYEEQSEKKSEWSISKLISGLFSRGSRSMGGSQKAQSPSWVAGKITDLNAIFIIDEFDVIGRDEDKKKIAELIKQLSDRNSKLKIVIVGIAETAQDLHGGHPSVVRNIREVKVNRMSHKELFGIIQKGEERLGIQFESDVKDRIIRLSSGYPHFTHLLALKAAEEAIIEERKTISTADLDRSMSKAANDAEGILKRSYKEAALSGTSDEYKKVLIAAASLPNDEIIASELRQQYEKLFGAQITQQSLSNYLYAKLVADDDSRILKRISKGVYKFTDPRMPSYVRIAQVYSGT